MNTKEKIILSLDVSGHEETLNIVKKFKDYIDIFKVDSELFTVAGPIIIEEINSMGKKVFLDLKYHDIPNIISKAAAVAAELGVFMFTVHTLSGFEMMKKVAHTLVELSLKRNIERPRIIGVTILTSIDQTILRDELGIGQSMITQVKHLSSLALKAGLDGVVTSPEEIEAVRARCEKGFLIVTPGIRSSWFPEQDQKRTMTPRKALNLGADYLVIGKAILSQPDPINALKRIEKEINV